MSEPLTVVIDGIECTCDKGEYIYDVAVRNGIHIPTLCRHDGFEDHRACCRICIVEVEERGRTKVVTSCVYPIAGPCEIRTNTERIREERAVLLALLQHRAPEAEGLEEIAQELDMSGFDRLVAVDGEKCILCGLCVQACDSLGTGAISTVLRGIEKMVDTPYGKPSEFCVGCLSCANVCPTGAIEYSEADEARTIWNREFSLVRCSECGEVIGTPEQIARAKATGGEAVAALGEAGESEPPLCDACRKRAIADEMMRTYRYV